MSAGDNSRFDRFLRQRSVWKSVELLAQGQHLPAPLSVEWHLTTACNLACPNCLSRGVLHGPAFRPERARTLAVEIAAAGVKGVVLSGGGEPLCHPSAAEVATSLAHNGVGVGLVTNGLLLHHHEAALAAACRFVRVSLDAATAETHRRARPRARGEDPPFEALLDNIRRLAARGGAEVDVSFVVFSTTEPCGRTSWSNVGEIAAAATLARDLGCAGFEVQMALDTNLALTSVPPTVRARLATELDAARAIRSASFRVNEGPSVHVALSEAAAPETDAKPYARCPAVRLSTLITPRGAFLCPYKDAPGASYGDPHATPFADLWRSAALQAAQDAVRPVEHCRFPCMNDPRNRVLLSAIEEFRSTGARPDLLPDEDPFV